MGLIELIVSLSQTHQLKKLQATPLYGNHDNAIQIKFQNFWTNVQLWHVMQVTSFPLLNQFKIVQIQIFCPSIILYYRPLYIYQQPQSIEIQPLLESSIKPVRIPSSKGSSNNFFDENEEEKVQVNGKVIKFINKSCTSCGEQVSKFMNLL